ncbi:ankyrin repeat-containing protein [Fusarium circinatum]|uniref:Ankyrin repeat-containing protein n=1 Tax=Fusarium circinatum TaxID=48490 RepID=A0A8H5SNQ7_FUSCI|nr:ankyrin repeat-containing protein [Fusarium circinatum]
MGTVKASQCAAVVAQQFPNIRFALLIGIGGGIPSADVDIRLGDVAVSIPQDSHPGVIEYDYGKYNQHGQFVLKGSLDKPAPILLSADMSLQMDEMEDEFPIDEMLKRISRKPLFFRPSRDILFADSFHHIGGKDCSGCDSSSQKQVVDRRQRDRDVIIHRGLILSGGGVIKNPEDRDRLRRGNGQAICYEMEAAGIMDQIPCLVIRGICDYADTHKNDEWHYYAAAAAAAYGGAILMKVRGEQVRQTSRSYRQEILNWIGQPDWRHAQHEHFAKHEPGTGQWFLDHPDFEKWVNGDKQILLCQGDPGAGKTVMASVMINHLKSRVTLKDDGHKIASAIIFFYFNSGEREQQRPHHVMWNLLRQLVENLPDPVPHGVADLFERYKADGSASLKIEDIMEAVYDAAASITKLFIVIDAIDEGEEADLKELLPRLFELQNRANTCIAATSRYLGWIRDIFQRCGPTYASLRIEAANEDVERYLDERLKNHEVIQACESMAQRSSLVKEVQDGIKDAAQAIFLLVRFHMEEVNHQISENGIKATVTGLPDVSNAYEEIYGKTIDRIRGQSSESRLLASKTLKWVVCARERLTIAELREAVAVNADSSYFDRRDESPIKLIISACKGLVTVEDNKTVRLLHHTTREYFDHNFERLIHLDGPELSKGVQDSEATEKSPTSAKNSVHMYLALICITYISFETFETGPCRSVSSLENRLESNRLYRYAASHWLYHLDCAKGEMLRDRNRQCVVKFLHSLPKLQASGEALFHGHRGKARWLPEGNFTCVHLAAFSGSDHMVSFLFHNERYPIDQEDSHKRTPLSYAAEMGHYSTVQLLIECGAMVNTSDWLKRTPLYHAVAKEQLEIAEQLLAIDAAIEGDPQCEKTPLLVAVSSGCTDIVQLLTARGADVNRRGPFGETPLTLAIEMGCLDVARILINHGASVTNEYHEALLIVAAKRGYKDIFRLLFGTKTPVADNENANSPSFETSIRDDLVVCRLLVDVKALLKANQNMNLQFYEAVKRGNLDICKSLIENGAGVEGFDEGKCALAENAARGNLETCRYLLANKAPVDGCPDQDSPLARAARTGRLMVCQFLLDNGARVDGNQGTSAPLSEASIEGHLRIARLLRARGADQGKIYTFARNFWSSIPLPPSPTITLGSDSEVCENEPAEDKDKTIGLM